MLKIFKNEWRGWLRTGRLRAVFLSLLAVLIAVSYFGAKDIEERLNDTERSRNEVRQQWENMGPSNPHSAAHYGSYAFKPLNPLSSLDEGVNLVAGRVLRLEGHVQNEVVHSSQSQSNFISYFGPLKASVLLQIILPVLIIFLTFYGIKSEQEQGRIKLLIIQGLPFQQVVAGKVLAVWFLSQLVLLITIAAQWLSFGLLPTGDLLLRSGLLFLVYSAFYGIVASFTAILCITFAKGATALTGMLAIWVLWLVFIPKISSWWVEENAPLPSRQEFKEAMREDRSKGIDGHNPTGDREKDLRDSVLLAYGVSTLDSLPINYDGIRMQADEEYGNKVWDKHFGALFEAMQDQKASLQKFGLINPFMTLQSLSMGISGTDQWSHLHFQKEAESYRRVFIKELNDEHAYGGSKSGDWGWKAEQAFFNEIDDFQYELPVLSQAGSTYQIDWIILFSWLTVSIFGLFLFSNKMKFVSL